MQLQKPCLIKKVDFKCFKYISDNANSSANKDWINNVAKGKALFIDYMTSHY